MNKGEYEQAAVYFKWAGKLDMYQLVTRYIREKRVRQKCDQVTEMSWRFIMTYLCADESGTNNQKQSA